jgi:hypothetical protein
MTRYQWAWIRLYGTYWSALNYGASTDEQASERKQESEQKLTDLLNDGWQIITVVPQAPNGVIGAGDPTTAPLKQEVWSVFLQKPQQ